MENAFSRSWEITKIGFRVLKQDRELLVFPILSGLLSILFILVILFPSIVLAIQGKQNQNFNVMNMILLFIIYLVLSFIATFFSVCVVYTTKKRFEGGNATFSESIRFATSRIYLIFIWSIISATIGLVLRIIDNLAEKLGPIGEIILKITETILGIVWGIATIFVVPILVYNNVGPITALKQSVITLKKTWGESLVRYIGLGLVEFILLLVGVLVTILLGILTYRFSPYFAIILALMGVVYILGVIIVFSIINSIFNTALYVYATKGKIPMGYSKEMMNNALRRRNLA